MNEVTNSIVEYLYEAGGPRPFKCGYCKCPDTSYTKGVWGYKMTCATYQELVDRGFQRSGKYVYKPEMKATCCPQYVIRLNTKNFKLSKSQRSSVKKFKRYLLKGKQPVASVSADPCQKDPCQNDGNGTSVDNVGSSSAATSNQSSGNALVKCKVKKIVKPGVGPDPSKPLCKKAKLIRLERRKRKQAVSQTAERPVPSDAQGQSSECSEQRFCQHLAEVLSFPKENCVHKFETKLVRVDSQEFTDSYEESFQVFKKFQMIIHKESGTDCGKKQFDEFLVYTPLSYTKGAEQMSTDFGSYHQQYLLDDKIFAVGVLDILPKGVLCEYLYYDPDYRFIAPGVITALLEILMAQQFHLENPNMQHYYMGFYVQSCPKMNYKRRYSASELLCPETYTYIPLEKCIPMLKASAYSRLAEEGAHPCSAEQEPSCVPVLADSTLMLYTTYTTINGNHADDLMKEYIELLGMKIACNITLYLRR